MRNLVLTFGVLDAMGIMGLAAYAAFMRIVGWERVGGQQNEQYERVMSGAALMIGGGIAAGLVLLGTSYVTGYW